MGSVRASIGLSLAMFTSALGAQATPLLFSVTPTAGPSKSSAYGYYELGYGERTFEPVAGDGLTVGGGPILRATRSDFASAADRPLPARNGYVLRSAVGFNW